MKKLLLLGGMMLLLAGCASTAGTEPGKTSRQERVADSYAPTGTFIPRKKSERGATNTTEIDKQTFENDRMNSNGTNNAIGR